ncbi:hypothetical protein G7B40_002490 [Aetokthonos hydrillicola Thurmond2011]|uniref:Uncharacterized protein n=1 Tax=Aetokthonos hydrillicola Thurmond2011 TaxID=2712845 RepID=A0AAP5I493_9CYAN|nr:hypothetical protein [Aetokthonos hydrillicola]MBO3462904.1 hypothetical protein [Aetokthonos hydrillicola CCALA 1050]MBW4588143.1 hypothetical protein [Aetokthonos hydrillicola CCALA 1050]MDR9893457.1 hypothetical protein [Aetokthonos hydrillicola Thurmond2011]
MALSVHGELLSANARMRVLADVFGIDRSVIWWCDSLLSPHMPPRLGDQFKLADFKIEQLELDDKYCILQE